MSRPETKKTIIRLLKSTKRKGMVNLINWLTDAGFFEGIASARHHGCYEGGLAAHSLGVYELLVEFNKRFGLDETGKMLIIPALLHDVCKVGAYVRTQADDGWTNNRDKDEGHAVLSINRISAFIKLTELEELMIKYHMGVYGLNEFDEKSGEYHLRGGQMANAWYYYPIVKLMYFCDELETLGVNGKEVEE